MLEDVLILISISLITSFMMFSTVRQTLLRKVHHIKLSRRSSYDIFGAHSDDEDNQSIHHPNQPQVAFVDEVDPDGSLKKSQILGGSPGGAGNPDDGLADIFKSSPLVYAAISKIRDFIVRDFINSWYSTAVSDDEAFSKEVGDVIDHAFQRLAARMLKVDWASFLMSEAILFLTNLLRHVRLIEEDMMKINKEFATETDANKRNTMLLTEILLNNQLHPGVNDPKGHLRKVSARLIKVVMKESDHKCTAARLLVREVLTCNVRLC
jgi:hypothetical protein